MKSEWWFKNTFFDENECLDWRIGMSAFTNTKIRFIDEKLYFYRKHNNQVTSNTKIEASRMDPVYLQWKSLSNYYELSCSSRGVFDLMATPWRLGEVASQQELQTWISGLAERRKDLPDEIYQNIVSLISRRYIFATRLNTISYLSRSKYFSSGFSEIAKLLKELLVIARN
jgi:hypothetical protein